MIEIDEEEECQVTIVGQIFNKITGECFSKLRKSHTYTCKTNTEHQIDKTQRETPHDIL